MPLPRVHLSFPPPVTTWMNRLRFYGPHVRFCMPLENLLRFLHRTVTPYCHVSWQAEQLRRNWVFDGLMLTCMCCTEQSVTLCSVIWRQYLHTIFMDLFFEPSEKQMNVLMGKLCKGVWPVIKKRTTCLKHRRRNDLNQTDALLKSHNPQHNNNLLCTKPCRSAPAFQTY